MQETILHCMAFVPLPTSVSFWAIQHFHSVHTLRHITNISILRTNFAFPTDLLCNVTSVIWSATANTSVHSLLKKNTFLCCCSIISSLENYIAMGSIWLYSSFYHCHYIFDRHHALIGLGGNQHPNKVYLHIQ